MGDARIAPRRAAAFAVWYLRAVAFVNFLSAVWVSLGQDVRRHNQENFFTPYLLTAGFASGVFTAFLAITMRRRKHPQPRPGRFVPRTVRLRNGVPGDPAVRPELDLAGPHRPLRGRPAGRA